MMRDRTAEATRVHRMPARTCTPIRRTWLAAVLAPIIALMIPPAEARDEPPARPNILLILADDLGYSDIGCHGGEIATPNLDRLAAGGLRFRQFYNGTRCCPTRASLLTGLYPHQAGVGGMNQDTGRPGYRGFPRPNTVTLAEVLKSAGYHTSMVGKWHLSAGDRPPHPTDRGFDEFYGMIGGFNSCFQEDPFYTRLPKARTRRNYDEGAFYSTDAFGDYSLDFLAESRKAGKPFFQYLAFNAPHFPLHARPEDIRKYANTYSIGWDRLREQRHARQVELGLIDPSTPLTPRSPFTTRRDFLRSGMNPAWEDLDADRRTDLARRMAVYAAMVDRLDHTVGRVVADLQRHGELENTLILFLSDNGACAEWDPFGFDRRSGPENILHTGASLDAMGGPDSYMSYGSGWANAGNTPFRMYKHDAYEGGIRTPLIVHWPRAIADGGAFRDQVGHIIDVMATLVDVARADYPATVGTHSIQPMEGTSLVPAFSNRPIERDFLAWEHEGNRAVRVGDWKIVSQREEGDAWHLYNLKSDPVELNDLAAAMPDRVNEMAARWDAWAERCHVARAKADRNPRR
jgi:arylsulfatase